jgi:hypothetical protein
MLRRNQQKVHVPRTCEDVTVRVILLEKIRVSAGVLQQGISNRHGWHLTMRLSDAGVAAT